MARRSRGLSLILSEYPPDAVGAVIPPDEHSTRVRHAARVHKPVTSRLEVCFTQRSTCTHPGWRPFGMSVGDRPAEDTAGSAAAGHRGAVRGSRRARRACVRRTRRMPPPRNGETPGLNPGRLRRVTLAAHSLSTARPSSPFTAGPSGLARRRCALEAVEKLSQINVAVVVPRAT